MVPITVGSSGAITPGATEVDTAVGSFSGIACVTASNCVALAFGPAGGAAVQITVTGPTTVTFGIPQTTGTDDLDSLACPTASACVAAGVDPSASPGGVALPVTVATTGALTLGNPQATGTGAVGSIACPSASSA